jgi:catalase
VISKQLAQDLVGAFDALFGGNPEVRAAHAKGTCCTGTFTATPEAAELTRAPHMQGEPVRTTVRFSNGSGSLDAHDSGREPRGMAVKFHLDERKSTDIVSINHSVFIVKTPEEVLEFMRLRTPDPETGKINLEALGAFVAARPGSERAAQILLTSPPLASFLQAEYFAIHAFKFIAADGSVRFGRYRWEPGLGKASLDPAEAREKDADYLSQDLLARLAEGPATFTLHVQIADDSDDPTDPTVEWPAERPVIRAGVLEIQGPVADPEAQCERLTFDPGALCDGIEESGDLILNARPRAYSVSITRRFRARA